jgi:hypothetical protein
VTAWAEALEIQRRIGYVFLPMNPPQPTAVGSSDETESTAEMPALDLSRYTRSRDPSEETTQVPVLRAAPATTGARALAAAESRALELENLLRVAQERIATLETLLDDRDVRISAGEQKLEVAQAEVDELRSAARLAADRDDLGASVRMLQHDVRQRDDRIVELEGDLRAAEEHVHRIEAELRSRKALRSVEAAASPAIDPAAMEAQDGEGIDFAHIGAVGPVRLLVKADDDSEVNYVLGRRTSIGRGPDNEIQLATQYVSRHHAVIIAGPHQTFIEDLRSTNGIAVNGRRTSRTALSDGDVVHVGKSRFRFVQR